LTALGFLGPRVRRVDGYAVLSRQNERDFLRWTLGVAGREIGGLRLDRNSIGWCKVTIAGRQQ
jgi:hypothetical protein